MVELGAWTGLIKGRSDPTDSIRVEVPITYSPAGSSGTFLALASDQRRWWVKPLNNAQGPRVTLTEHLIACAGRLIGAPTCQAAVIEIPAEVAGWEFRPGLYLEAGLAHASLAVDDVQEARTLDYRERNDNQRRHAGVYAIYDWCWGGDEQWLYCETADRKLYSHDHGFYLPETGPDWTKETLLARVNEPHQFPHTANGVDAASLHDLAIRLDSVSQEELVVLLKGVPASWSVLDAELETLGYFLQARAPGVAQRLRNLAGQSI